MATGTRKTGKVNVMSEAEEKAMVKFILYLHKGYQEFGEYRYLKFILRIATRYTTAKIGECKNLRISEKALKKAKSPVTKDNVYKTLKRSSVSFIKEHKIPAQKFFAQFDAKGKKFTKSDAEQWLKDCTIAIITKDEDDKLTKAGYREERPIRAYSKLGIKLTKL